MFPKNKRIVIALIITLIPAFAAIGNKNDSLKWKRTTSPIRSDLKNISFLSSQNGIASGNQIIFCENNSWHKYVNQPPSSIDQFYAIDTNSFYVTSRTKYQESLLYYGDGKTWNIIQTPLANTIHSVYFTDSKNGIIAGLGEIALLKDNQWEWLPPPHNEIISTIRYDKNSVIWAYSLGIGLYKYNGGWTKIKDSEKVTSVQFFEDSIYLLGNDFLGIVTPENTIKILSTNQQISKLSSFFVVNNNDVFAVGHEGLIMHFKKGNWLREESGVTQDLYAIWMNSNNAGWIVGNDGVILILTSDKIEPFDSNSWGGFETVTFNSYAKVVDDEYGVIIADFNHDDLIDIFTCGLYEEDHLYINSGSMSFMDKARQWNVSGSTKGNLPQLNLGACAGDFDNDGDNDLYVSVLNGYNRIYKNIRGNYFVDYSKRSRGKGDEGDRSNASILGDVDNDGDLDIFVVNEQSSNRLFLNNGAGIFSELTESSGLSTRFGGTGCSFGDIDNDNDLDLFVTNWSAKNILYKNLLRETGQLIFEKTTDKAKVGGEVFSKSNSVVFSDIDNDADLDLFVTNRKTSNELYLNNGNGVFTDMTDDLIGKDSLKSYGAVIYDFDGDGYKDIYVSNIGNNVFFKNIEGRKFIDYTTAYQAGIEGYSTGSAVGDFDNNGSPDIYVANYLGESSAILRNRQSNQNFIKVNVVGVENNRSGIGAKIFVYKKDSIKSTTELLSFIEVSGGSGYASMNQRFLPIPLMGNQFVDVKIIFPSGSEKVVHHVKAGSNISIVDKTGLSKLLLKTSQWLLRYVKDPLLSLKLLVWIMVLLIIFFSLKGASKKYGWSKLDITVFRVLLVLLFFFEINYFENKNVWVFTIFPALSIVVLIIIVRLFFERIRIRKMALVEQEQIREKLSRDLHDDLATTVSTIGIYLTLISYKLNDQEEKTYKLLDQATSLVHDATSSITDLIWAISPKPQSLDDLLIRIKSNFFVLFQEKGINFRCGSQSNIEHIVLNDRTKQNVYLIIKEALNNTLKYAEATLVEVNVKYEDPKIYITIRDVGKGFDPSSSKNKGHGLGNMKRRAQEINAHFEIKSTSGEGTEISLEFTSN